MGLIKTLNEIGEFTGENTADFLTGVASKVREFSCDLYSRYPNGILGSANPAGSVGRGVFNSLCRDLLNTPLPTIEQPEHTGGQCEGVMYRVTARVFSHFPSDFSFAQNSIRTFDGRGRFLGVLREVIGQNNQNYSGFGSAPTEITRYTIRFADRDFLVINPGFEPLVEVPGFEGAGVENITITRLDGLPDDCGNAPPSFAPDEPLPENFDTVIVLPQPDGVDLNLDISVANNQLSFPLNLVVAGIDVEVNSFGIEFNFGSRNSSDIPESLPNGERHPLPVPKDDKNRCFAPSAPVSLAPEDFDEEVIEESDSLECIDIEGLRYVTLQVGELPTNIKSQDGGNADTVYYLGWFYFKVGSENFPRQPIHFINNVFVAPEGATGFAYTLYNGLNATATKFTQN